MLAWKEGVLWKHVGLKACKSRSVCGYRRKKGPAEEQKFGFDSRSLAQLLAPSTLEQGLCYCGDVDWRFIAILRSDFIHGCRLRPIVLGCARADWAFSL